MRLTTKLILALSLLSMSVLAATLGLLYFAEKRHLVAQLERRHALDLSKLARVCADSVLDENELSRLTYLKTFMSSAEPGLIAYAVFLDNAGRVVLHSDFVKDDFTLYKSTSSDPVLLRARDAPDVLSQDVPSGPRRLLVLSAPVAANAKRLGTVALAYDRGVLDQLVETVQRETLGRFSQAIACGLLTTLVFAFLIARALTRPIRELSEGARLIGAGKLETRIAGEGKDELGDLAREFNQMAQKLGELDELKDSFLAQITHDLRNPLGAVLGYAEMMLMGIQGPLTKEQTHSLDVITKNGQYLSELINNMLDLAKLEAGRMDYAVQPVRLKESAASVVELMKVKAAEYGVAVDCSRVPAETVVHADEQSLRRVLINLVSNALKFTPKGGTVSIEWSRTPEGRDRVAVNDTGIGIPKDKLGALFQKFSQVKETKNKVRETKGTGLGLVICKQIVEGHGGSIGVESEYQKGTTFFFTLPPGGAA